MAGEPKPDPDALVDQSTESRTRIFVGPAPPPRPGAQQRSDTDHGDSESSGGERTRRLQQRVELGWIADALEGKSPETAATFGLHPGVVLPGTRYRIVRWLGDGGMGIVYEAEHVDLGRHVALKVLRPECTAQATLVAQFREEARAATSIGSDHIVQVFDFGELPDGRLFFTMELLKGQRLIDSRGQIEPARLIGILRQVCKGLAAAHDAGVLHRDMKPDNVMLVLHHGRADFVKILDFGLAAMLGTAASAAVNAGTPSYMAPELIMAFDCDHRVDVYELGITAYEMLAGRPPFASPELREVLLAHLESKPESITKVSGRTDIPRALEAVVMRCLNKQPEDRYRDMLDLEAALCEAQIAAGLTTPWDDLPLPEVDSARRDRLLREMPDPTAGARRAPRRRWVPAAAGVAAALALSIVVALAVREPPPTAADDAIIEEITVAARAAAAEAFFVYPPPGDPQHSTAYARVLELESIEGRSAAVRKRARELRREFAGTLIRLGDQYWESAGGKAFAIDYYAQALMFEPDDAHAAGRVTMTPGQLAVLHEKAVSGEFTEAELVAAEPLVVLAETDPSVREERTKTLVARTDRSATGKEQLASLLGEGAAKPKAPSAAATPTPSVGESAEVTPEVTPGAAPGGSGATAARPAATAVAACVEGEKALKGSRLDEAERAFDRALALDRKSARALIGLSDVNFHRAAYGKAVSFAEKAVALAPKSAAYRIRLGDAYFKVLRYTDARDAYQKALDLGDTNAKWRLDKAKSKIGE